MWVCNKCGTELKAMETKCYCVDYRLKKRRKDPTVVRTSAVRSSASEGIALQYFCPNCKCITDEDIDIEDIGRWED